MTLTVHVFGNTHHHNPNMIRFMERYARPAAGGVLYLVCLKPGEDASLYHDLPHVRFYRHPLALLFLIPLLPRRVIFHSLGSGSAWLALLARIDLPARTSWVVWGADFVSASAAPRSVKDRILAALRHNLVRRLQSVGVLTPADADAFRAVFAARALHYCPYPILGLSKSVTERVAGPGQPVRVLVGNSAGESNRHFELLDLLASVAAPNCRFLLPLNYAGSPEYVQRVIEHAQRVLPGRCEFLTRMMSNAEYETVLDDIDIIVFNHDRQQGLYVVYYGLLGGKKIYLRQDASSYVSLTALGATIGSTLDIAHTTDFADPLSVEQRVRNRQICEDNFTEQACGGRWSRLVAEER